MIDPNTLIGRWDILAWEQLYDDGRRQLPLGEQLEGFLRYTEEGDLIVMVARRDRPAFTTGGQWNADEAEKAGAYGSMLSYAGTYELQGNTVIHRVDISLFPNWKGGEQKRRLELRDNNNTLAIKARLEEGTPQARTAQLLWRRHGC